VPLKLRPYDAIQICFIIIIIITLQRYYSNGYSKAIKEKKLAIPTRILVDYIIILCLKLKIFYHVKMVISPSAPQMYQCNTMQ